MKNNFKGSDKINKPSVFLLRFVSIMSILGILLFVNVAVISSYKIWNNYEYNFRTIFYLVIIITSGIIATSFGYNLKLKGFQKINHIINHGLLLGTAIICFILLECALRIIVPENTNWSIVYKNVSDNDTPYSLKPNLDITVTIGHEQLSMKTNSLGMRWREVSYNNPLKKTRIAFVGDSFTLGCWADKVENSFVGVFDNTIDSKKYEALNFGMGANGLNEALLIIKNNVLLFKPAFVVLNFYNGNDFRDTYLGLHKHKLVDGVMLWNMRIIEEKIPEIYRQNFYPTSSSIFSLSFLNHSMLYQQIKKFRRTKYFTEQIDISPVIDKYSYTSMNFMSQDPYPDIARETIEVNFRKLDEIRKLLNNAGIILVITSLPTSEQIYSKKLIGKGFNLNNPQNYLYNYTKMNSIYYLDLLPIFRLWVREHHRNIFFYGDNHYNNTGHSVTGRAIASFFDENFNIK